MQHMFVPLFNDSVVQYPIYNFSEVSTVFTTTNENNAALRNEKLANIEVAVQVAIFTLAVFGNFCVLLALWKKKRKVTRMHIFIMHLSIADLLVAAFNILPQMIWDITNKFEGGDFLCRFIKYMQIFVMYLSTYILVMTAIDRYRAICHPLSNHTWTPRLVKVMIGGAYCIAGVFSIPQFIIFRYQEREVGGIMDCWVKFNPMWTLDLYVISFTVLVYIIPLLILITCYGSICFTIWKKYRLSEESGNYIKHKELRKDSKEGNRPSTSYTSEAVLSNNRRSTPSVNIMLRSHSFRGFSKAKLKTVKLTFIIILAYIVCWSPFFISQLWWLWNPTATENDAVVIMLLLASLNSCCNPWIYLAFSGNMVSNLNPCRCKNNNVLNSPVEGKSTNICLCSCAEIRTNGIPLHMNNSIQRESETSTKSSVVTFSSDQHKIKSVIIPLQEFN